MPAADKQRKDHESVPDATRDAPDRERERDKDKGPKHKSSTKSTSLPSSSCPLLLHIPLMGNCCSDPVNFDGDVDLYHFDLHRAVGKGAFGKVCLLRPPHGSSPSLPVFFSARRSES